MSSGMDELTHDIVTKYDANKDLLSSTIGSPSALTYCFVDDENIENTILTNDDIQSIIAGKRPDLYLDPQEKITRLKVIKTPISYTGVTNNSLVHNMTILYTNSATYAVEKFDYGIMLTKGGSLYYILRSKEISSFETDRRYKEPLGKGKDSIGCVLEYLLNNALDVKYHLYHSNCIVFARSLWQYLTEKQGDNCIHSLKVDIHLFQALFPKDTSPLPEDTSILSQVTSISPKPILKDRVRDWVCDHFSSTKIWSQNVFSFLCSQYCQMNKIYVLQAVCLLALLYFSWGQVQLMIPILLLTSCAVCQQASVILGRIRDCYRTRYGHFGNGKSKKEAELLQNSEGCR